MSLFLISNGAMQTTAAPVHVTTGTSIKTMLQVRPLGFLRVFEWGFSFDAAALVAPITVELITSGTVFATVTAHVEAGVTKLDDLTALAATYMTFSTTGTGYTSSSEGTVTATRNLDAPQHFSVLSQPLKVQIPLGYYPVLPIGDAMRIRVTAAAALNMYCYVKLAT